MSSLDDWISRQPTLVTKKRRVLDVVVQRGQIAEGLTRHLERLGLKRRAQDVDLAAELAALHRTESPPPSTDQAAAPPPKENVEHRGQS